MLPRRVLLIVILVAGVHAAGCADGTLESKRGAIRLEQSELTFAPTVVGSTSTMKFRVTNVSRVVAFDSNGNRLWGTPFSAMPLLQGRGAWALAVDDQGQIAVLFGTASWSDPSTSGALVIVDPQNGAVITWTDEVAQLPTRHVFEAEERSPSPRPVEQKSGRTPAGSPATAPHPSLRRAIDSDTGKTLWTSRYMANSLVTSSSRVWMRAHQTPPRSGEACPDWTDRGQRRPAGRARRAHRQVTTARCPDQVAEES